MVYGGAWLGMTQIIQANVSRDVDKVEKIHKWQIRQIDQPYNTRNTHTEDKWDPHNQGMSSKISKHGKSSCRTDTRETLARLH